MSVIVSQHPCLKSFIARIRDGSSNGRTERRLCRQATTILSVEATAGLFHACQTSHKGLITPLGVPFSKVSVTPENVVAVPILRSGLSMIDGFLEILPFDDDIPIHHLGLFRDKHTLAPIEYYNRLPSLQQGQSPVKIAFILDPIIATGGTCIAAIQALQDWGVDKIVVLSLIASQRGIDKILDTYSSQPERIVLYIAQVDPGLSDTGYIVPGCGDIGDRLYNTK